VQDILGISGGILGKAWQNERQKMIAGDLPPEVLSACI
jgi:hypothetical protein